jgi:hypothetical protein
MRVAALDLAKEWDRLVKQGKFTRPHKDEQLDIEYGVSESGGDYSFFVSGKEKDKNGIWQGVTTENFIDYANEGVFQKQFNRLRKLRPGGQDRKPGRQEDLQSGVEKCGFYCQEPKNPLSLLVRPLLGTLTSTDSLKLRFAWNVYPNLAPFEPGGHFLFLPSGGFPELPHFPQVFTPFLLEDCMNICRSGADLMVFFNSRHAGATQDHFHLQAVFHSSKSAKLAIESAIESAIKSPDRSNTGPARLSDYPLNALVYTLEDKAHCQNLEQDLRELQTKDVPFDLIFLAGQMVLVPRDINNEIVAEFPNLLASMEVSGKFIIPERDVFQRTTEERIRVALGRIALPLDCIA